MTDKEREHQILQMENALRNFRSVSQGGYAALELDELKKGETHEERIANIHAVISSARLISNSNVGGNPDDGFRIG